jgi:hypothetical protein
MAAHEAPAAVHDHIAADYARRRALELVAQSDTLTDETSTDLAALWSWVGQATSILRELARG